MLNQKATMLPLNLIESEDTEINTFLHDTLISEEVIVHSYQTKVETKLMANLTKVLIYYLIITCINML